jgi:PAS domain S-box-containing protein
MIPAPAEMRDARILVVDDQLANVNLLEETLRQTGYTNVTSTMDATRVCALHRANDYDLILLDLQMPVMDGFQVMEALKSEERSPWLPVLVITAQPAHKMRALEAGARDFISKPFDLVEVTTRIRNMLEVRVLYRRLKEHSDQLEATVLERTAALRESEARYRSMTELASDWYWEQDEAGNFTKVSGPVLEMLGIRVDGFVDAGGEQAPAGGWNAEQRNALQAAIAAREPFLDFVFHRRNADGSRQTFQVSGEPVFGPGLTFMGYRGVGVEIKGEPGGRS